VYLKTLAPKNLKGADTRFTTVTVDAANDLPIVEHSMFETRYAKLLYATHNIKAKDTKDLIKQVKAVFKNDIGEDLDKTSEALLKNIVGDEYNYRRMRRRLVKKQQRFLTKLQGAQEVLQEQHKLKVENPSYSIILNEELGDEHKEVFNVTSVNVIPAQIIMGRYYAKQFGLTSQDSIGDILSNKDFF
jgi:hypothetical protein